MESTDPSTKPLKRKRDAGDEVKEKKEKKHKKSKTSEPKPADDTATAKEIPDVDAAQSAEDLAKAERKKAKKEKKAAAAAAAKEDTNGSVAQQNPEAATSAEMPVAETEKAKKKKKSKKAAAAKEHTEGIEAQHITAQVGLGAEATMGTEEPKKKKKKKEKAAKAPEDDAEKPAAETNGNHRFVCFVGNLPYTATQESVTAHFAKIHPDGVRHRTEKGTTKSKGFAFVEFNEYDRMLTCLKLYHHSNFDDGKSAPRQINVELTAGGGGSKSEHRKEKLRVKNERLGEQRRRRAEQEEIERVKKEKKDKKDGKGKGENGAEVEKVDTAAQGGHQESTMHPSRLAMINSQRH